MKRVSAVLVNLTIPELMIAWNVAMMHHAQNINRGAKAKYGQAPIHTAEAFAQRVLGCEAEYAAAKAFNKFYSGSVGNYKANDVGKLEVRAIDNPKKNLILHKDDKDDSPYILIEKKGPQDFEIIGWIMGYEGKQDVHWKEPQPGRPCYLVPRGDLNRDLDILYEWG